MTNDVQIVHIVMDKACISLLCGEGKVIYSFEDRCVATDKKVVVKVSNRENFIKKEVKVLRFLSSISYSSILIDEGESHGYYYIRKKYIDGDTLENVLHKLKCEDLKVVMNDIADEIKRVHEFPFPGDIPKPYQYYVNEICGTKEMSKYVEKVREISKDAKIGFCHGDFHPRNIIIKDSKFVGFIDWEFAGYYPVASDGSFERFWVTPGMESFSQIYDAPPKIMALEHTIYCIKTGDTKKAERILMKL